MAIENKQGVHSKERLQYSKNAKTTSEKYREHCNIDFSKCASDTTEDVSKRGKVIILNK